MILVIILDLLMVATLFYKASQKGVENALPAFAFFTVLLPESCMIPIPGVFGLSAQRLAVVTLLLCFFLFRRDQDGTERPASTPLIFLILFQLAWSLLSTANSIVPLMSLKKLLSVVLEYYVVYFIFYKSISSSNTIKRIVVAMVVAMIATTIPGVVEAYTGWQVASVFPELLARFGFGNLDEARGIRTQSTFQHAILYGGALAMTMPLTLFLISTSKPSLKKKLLWASLMLMFLCLYKTTSRGPWMAAIAGFLLVFCYTVPGIRRAMLVIAAMCVLVMVVRPGVYDTIKDLYDETYDPNNPVGTSYEYRYALKDVSVAALSHDAGRKLWGFGMESFYYLQLEGPFMGKEGHKFESCDSAWIETMVETGYVGLGILLALMGSALIRTFRGILVLPKPDCYLQWIFTVALIQYFFLMMSVAIYGWGQNGYMLWMIIAMALSYPQVVREGVWETEISSQTQLLSESRPVIASNRV